MSNTKKLFRIIDVIRSYLTYILSNIIIGIPNISVPKDNFHIDMITFTSYAYGGHFLHWMNPNKLVRTGGVSRRKIRHRILLGRVKWYDDSREF